MRKFIEEERGSIIMLFAISLFIIIFSIGLGIDFSLLYTKRSELENFCQLTRADRFTYRDIVRFEDCDMSTHKGPGYASYNIVSNIMSENGFTGDIDVYFKEESYGEDGNFRAYKIRTCLSEDFDFHFMRIFGLKKIKIHSYVDGEEDFGERDLDVIWHPSCEDPNIYNGHYKGKAGSSATFVSMEFPDEW